MDEVWVRIGLVVAALAVAGLIVLIWRRGVRIPEREIEAPNLDPGLYFFSSGSCSTCESARDELIARAGEGGFEEYVWEREPQIFTDLGIDAVPAVLVMKEGGRGRLYPGQVRKALAGR